VTHICARLKAKFTDPKLCLDRQALHPEFCNGCEDKLTVKPKVVSKRCTECGKKMRRAKRSICWACERARSDKNYKPAAPPHAFKKAEKYEQLSLRGEFWELLEQLRDMDKLYGAKEVSVTLRWCEDG